MIRPCRCVSHHSPGRKTLSAQLVLISVVIFFHQAWAETFPRMADEDIASIIRLAESGDAEGQFSLAIMLDQGNSIPRDKQQAIVWYRNAAEQNLPAACLYLGMKYEFGNTVAKDIMQAVHWYRKAALQDWPSAQFMLGTLYLDRTGPVADPVKAYSWLSLAAEHDYPDADRAREDAAAMLTETGKKEADHLLQSLRQTIAAGNEE